MANSAIDQNRNPTLIGVSSIDLDTPTRVAVNPDTGAVIIDGTSLYANLDTRYLKLDASNDPITGDLLIQPTTDSTTAFQVNQADTTNVLTVDTTNERVGIGTATPATALHVLSVISLGSVPATSGYIRMFNNAGVNWRTSGNTANVEGFRLGSDDLFRVGNSAITTTSTGGTTTLYVQGNNLNVGIGETSPGAKLEIQGSVAATIGLIVQGAASQSANLLELQDSSATVGLYIDPNSDLIVEPIANSTDTLNVNQADGTNVFQVDTTNKKIIVTSGTTGQSTIEAGLIVNNASGNGAIDDFQVNTDTLTAILVDASADTMTLGVPTTLNGVLTMGANIVSDTDSTDDLGSSTVYWANAYIDSIYTDLITAGTGTNTNLRLLGKGTGYVQVGTTATSHTLNAPADLMVGGDFEVDGSAYFDGTATFAESVIMTATKVLSFNAGNPPAMGLKDAGSQTDPLSIYPGATDNYVLLTDYDNRNFDHGHAAQADPTLFIHSINQTTDEWMSFTHDQTDGYINVGTGNIKVGNSITSDTDSTDDLGTSSLYWANAYVDRVYLNATAYLDGATAGIVDVTGAHRWGGSTNYLQVSSTGVVSLAGTAKRWLAVRPDLDYNVITAQGKPTQVVVGVFHGYSMPIYNTDNEELFFNLNVPGRWDEASDIIVHLLVALSNAEDVGDYFKFQLSWEHLTEGDVIPATSHDVPVEQAVLTDRNAQYSTYELVFTLDYDVDDPDDVVDHDDLGMRLRRIDATNPDVTNEIIVLDYHVEFQVDKMFDAEAA